MYKRLFTQTNPVGRLTPEIVNELIRSPAPFAEEILSVDPSLLF